MKARSSSLSPPVVRSPLTPPSPSPSTSSNKKSRNVSSHMSDTSLFAKLVRVKHFKKKEDEDKDINGLSKIDKIEKNEKIDEKNDEKIDQKNVFKEDADSSKLIFDKI